MRDQSSICPECGYDQQSGSTCQRCGEKLVSFSDDHSIANANQPVLPEEVLGYEQEEIFEG